MAVSDDLEFLISPCVGVCALDLDTGHCRGCGRTEREIGLWRFEDNAWRRAHLEELADRSTDHGKPEWQTAYRDKIDRMLGRR
jgi:predicted Fe-S protein YdhL (DUF1289 family)